MASRFQRRAAAPDVRVGEILSDSNSDVSSLDEEDGGGRRGGGGGGASRAAPSTAVQKRRGGADPEVPSASDDSQHDDDDDDGDAKDTKPAVAARIHQRPAPVQSIKRKNSKWYDSEDDDDWDHMASDGGRGGARAARSRSVPEARRETAPPPPPPVNTAVEAAPRAVLSPEASTAAPAKQPPPEKRSSLQRFVGKTFNLSPFGSKRKQALENVTSPASSGPHTPRASERTDSQTDRASSKQAETAARMRSPMSDVSSVGDTGGNNATSARFSNASEQRRFARKKSQDPTGVLSDQTTTGSDVVSPQGYRGASATGATTNNDGSATSRRRSNMVQSPVNDDALVSPAMRRGSELPVGTTGGGASEALSPGQRKVPGAFPGRPDSGVLLEGWLRQKQRRGVKGMKKWNSRYFVLYAKTNEVRYYADVVQSAWGPVPLGEIGCISLRLIQRIGKPGTVKYKGCRLDITCRNTWGTHYADDYVSSDDENNNSNNAARSADKNTPKSSRVYSLMADSPLTAGAWFSMLDSLLVRSANSPRVDVAPSSGTGKQQLKRTGSMAVAQTGGANTPSAGKSSARRRTASTLDAESVVLCGPNDHVPRPVLYAINFIFDSSPGIETEKFYETEPDPARLKASWAALKFLNQFALDNTRKPSREELEQALDPVTAGAVVKLWLAQLEQPLVPFEMFDDFRAVAANAKSAPFELARNLKALVGALPPRHFAMLACVLFHLNDVSAYASKNGMDAGLLSGMFGDYIVRPRGTTPNNSNNAGADIESERQLLRIVVEEMIMHVDAIIDEKEAESLERV